VNQSALGKGDRGKICRLKIMSLKMRYYKRGKCLGLMNKKKNNAETWNAWEPNNRLWTSKSLMALEAVVCSCDRLMPESAAFTVLSGGEWCEFRFTSLGCCSLPPRTTSLAGMPLLPVPLSVTTICITSRARFISSTTESRFVRAEPESPCLNNV